MVANRKGNMEIQPKIYQTTFSRKITYASLTFLHQTVLLKRRACRLNRTVFPCIFAVLSTSSSKRSPLSRTLSILSIITLRTCKRINNSKYHFECYNFSWQYASVIEVTQDLQDMWLFSWFYLKQQYLETMSNLKKRPVQVLHAWVHDHSTFSLQDRKTQLVLILILWSNVLQDCTPENTCESSSFGCNSCSDKNWKKSWVPDWLTCTSCSTYLFRQFQEKGPS